MLTLYVLLGPTAVGKTEFALRMAESLGCPILNCDSRQIYRGMEIGTAAPTAEQLQRVNHYFVGTHSVGSYYSAAQYEQDVLSLVAELDGSHQSLLLSGGSMLYIDAVCNGIDDIPSVDAEVRETLRQRLANGEIDKMRSELQLLDPNYYMVADTRNPKRVVHALEVCYTTGCPYSSFLKGERKPRPFRVVKIGLRRERQELFERIGRRVDAMIEDGLLDENANCYLAALSGCGLAMLDLSTGEFFVESFETEAKRDDALVRYRPAEVVVPRREEDALSGNGAVKGLVRNVSETDAWTFQLDAAREALLRHFKVTSLDGFGLEGASDLVCAAGALHRTHSAHILYLLFKSLDLAAYMSAVGFQLGLTGAAGAYGAAAAAGSLTYQMSPHTCQTGKNIFVLCKLDLKLAFSGLGAVCKNIQDQCRAVYNAAAESILQGSCLRGRKLVVEYSQIYFVGLNKLAQLFCLALAYKSAGVGSVAVLHNFKYAFTACGDKQLVELRHCIFIRIVKILQISAVEAHKQSAVAFFLCIFGHIISPVRFFSSAPVIRTVQTLPSTPSALTQTGRYSVE